MTISELQALVDKWIKSHGVRYFDEKTNALLLMEEVGEFARLIARTYGEQSFKKEKDSLQIQHSITDELADIIFVICCLANQMGIDITKAMEINLLKKTERDSSRHKNNDKLKE